jgi:ADP-ribose pyrophosphatase YjhB (NUDIX family)
MKVARIPFPEFKRIYSRVPRLCVEVILIKNGKVLLVRRNIEPALGQWHTPGGTVLKGEQLIETVRRVAKEELGIAVQVKKFLGVLEYHSFKNYYSQDIGLAFLVEQKGSKKIVLDKNGRAYDFFSTIPPKTIKEQKEFLKKTLKFK